jgi:hypothetical protein
MSLSLNWPDVLKGIIVIFCTALFILLMKDALDKYRTELTSSGGRIEHSNEEKKNLPCMTFCPMPGKGFSTLKKPQRKIPILLKICSMKEQPLFLRTSLCLT